MKQFLIAGLKGVGYLLFFAVLFIVALAFIIVWVKTLWGVYPVEPIRSWLFKP